MEQQEETGGERISQILNYLSSDEPLPDSLRRTPTELPTPDVLAKEMLAHPFFMKTTPSDPEEAAESNPLLSALQQIKYSPEDNSPQELALSHKTDGLFHFKLKKYRRASLAFTEGLKYATKAEDSRELQANLYNNRGVCQFHLENYASALDDFKKASSCKDNYCKSQRKAVECCLKLSKWEQGQDFIKELKKDCKTPECSAHKGIAELERQLKIGKKQGQLASVKSAAKNLQEKKEDLAILEKIAERGIKIVDKTFLQNQSIGKVSVSEDGNELFWPVVFSYPENSQSDFVEAFSEGDKFITHLAEILDEEPPNWDRQKEYYSSNVDIYFVDPNAGLVLVDKEATLCEVMKGERYTLPSTGIPGFFVLAKNEFCKFWLERAGAI